MQDSDCCLIHEGSASNNRLQRVFLYIQLSQFVFDFVDPKIDFVSF
jgi:hypothetical protein